MRADALGIVLVIGVAVPRGRHDLGEVAGEGGEAPERLLPGSRQQLTSGLHPSMLSPAADAGPPADQAERPRSLPSCGRRLSRRVSSSQPLGSESRTTRCQAE